MRQGVDKHNKIRDKIPNIQEIPTFILINLEILVDKSSDANTIYRTHWKLDTHADLNTHTDRHGETRTDCIVQGKDPVGSIALRKFFILKISQGDGSVVVPSENIQWSELI